MSELAYNINGDAFQYPPTVAKLRVKLIKKSGAPALQYDEEGRPLTVSADATLEDLRAAVAISGKYRLDPVNEEGTIVENVPPAYIQVTKERNANDSGFSHSPEPRGDGALAGLGLAVVEAVRLNSEALRQNAEIAMRAVDRLPQLMDAMTNALNVASGNGLHALQQRELPRIDISDDDEDEPNTPATLPGLPAGIDLNAIIAQSVSHVTMKLIGKFMPSSVGSVVDLRKAHAEGSAEREKPAALPSPEGAAQPAQPPSMRTAPVSATIVTDQRTAATDASDAFDPATLVHMIEIQNALTPDERELATALAAELTPEQRKAWMLELKPLEVREAVQKIRAQFAKLAQSTQPNTGRTEGGAQ